MGGGGAYGDYANYLGTAQTTWGLRKLQVDLGTTLTADLGTTQTLKGEFHMIAHVLMLNTWGHPEILL